MPERQPVQLLRHLPSTGSAHRSATIGGRILSGSQSPLLYLADQITRTHHECWEGRSYPLGLRGEDIPIAGRIVSVADVFGALTPRGPYKEAWSTSDAAAEIEQLGGN